MEATNCQKINEFREHLIDEEKSSNTIDSYITTVKIFFEEFGELTKENMISFKQAQLEKWKPKTAANRCIAMNGYCEFMGKPECKVKGIKIHKQNCVENVISLDEYEYFLKCLKTDKKEKVYWMLKFLAKTGARASEFVRFEKDCLKTGQVTLWTKGKIRNILIPEELIAESAEYFSETDTKWLFPNKYGNQMSTRGVAEIVRKNGKKYGIREEVLHPHAFRHLFAKQFLKNNGNIALLADLMGHESVDTTAIYLKMSAEEQRDQFNAASKW